MKKIILIALFILLFPNWSSAQDVSGDLTVFEDSDVTVVVTLQDQMYYPNVLQYAQIKTFSSRLFFVPHSEIGDVKMIKAAATLAYQFGYTTEYLDKIKFRCIEGTFNLRSGTFLVNKITFIGTDLYPVYIFHVKDLIYFDDYPNYGKMGRTIADYYDNSGAIK